MLFALLAAANITSELVRQARDLFSDDELSHLPDLMLWAWERPEDLRFLDCEEVGVALLTKTIILDRGGMTVRPRLQPALLGEGCTVVSVVRVEAEESAVRGANVAETAAEIAETGAGHRVAAVQVDFDARASERGFYAALLENARERLPEDVGLSMTALASWCIHDDWIRDLPVDEAVPMLFRMGTDDRIVRQYLASGNELRVPSCRYSIGVSTDEPWPMIPARGRRYVFHPRSWEPAAAARVIRGGGR
jgi:hypothetical protein